MASVVENRRPLFFVDLRFVDLWGGRGRPPGQPARRRRYSIVLASTLFHSFGVTMLRSVVLAFLLFCTISAPGFFLAGDDRNYIVLDLFADDSWHAISHQFAHLLLNYNYPPTPGWFDEGFAEYFSSLRLENKQAQMGSDPELNLSWREDLI